MNPINVTKNGTLTLNTANKYVEDNIKVNVNVPSSSKELKTYQNAVMPISSKLIQVAITEDISKIVSYTVCMEGVSELGDVIFQTEHLIVHSFLYNGNVTLEPNPIGGGADATAYFEEGYIKIPTPSEFNSSKSYIVIIYYY